MEIKEAISKIENLLKELTNLTDSKHLLGKEELEVIKKNLPLKFKERTIIERFKKEKIAVHCDTEEKANDFLKLLQASDFIWRSDEKLTEDNNYRIYTSATCYSSNGNYVQFGEVSYYKKENYEIIAFDEFMKLYIDEIIDKEATVEKQETNYEHYKSKIILKANNSCEIRKIVGLDLLCSKHKHECGVCICDLFEFLNQPYYNTKIKLTQFEYDLLNEQKNYTNIDFAKFSSMNLFMALKEKGHFKGVHDIDMRLVDILDNCEVQENE